MAFALYPAIAMAFSAAPHPMLNHAAAPLYAAYSQERQLARSSHIYRIPRASSFHLPCSTAVRASTSVMTGGAAQSNFWTYLWPNTLCKFWGLHAGVWSLVAAAMSMMTKSVLPLPLVAANFALGELLYRSKEDFGKSLASGAGVYFVMHAAMLWRAPEALLSPLCASIGLPLGALRWLRLWHTLLAIGSFSFAVKAALKDRLFTEDGDMRGEFGSRAASTLPTLVFINKAAGAKVGARVAVALDAAAEEAEAAGRVLSVVDLSATPPEDALKAFAASHSAFRLLVCGGDGSAAWVLEAIKKAKLTGWDGKPYWPAMALLPLGTGNDLARVLGWGKGVRFEAIRASLDSLNSARVALLDRWMVSSARGGQFVQSCPHPFVVPSDFHASMTRRPCACSLWMLPLPGAWLDAREYSRAWLVQLPVNRCRCSSGAAMGAHGEALPMGIQVKASQQALVYSVRLA